MREVWDASLEAWRREGTLLAEDHWGRGAERDVNSRVLPTALAEGELVQLVVAQAQGRSDALS